MSAFPADLDQFDVRKFLLEIVEAESAKADDLTYQADDLRNEAGCLEEKADEHRDRVEKLNAALANIDPKIEQQIVHRLARITITPDPEMQLLVDQAKGLPFGAELAAINERYQHMASMKLIDVVTAEFPDMLLS